ncbi:MAG: PHP domain-containing protein [Thiotrichales bacterium]|nr:PHP domain-containing protein [Thiotrichales bacterium]
MKIDLHTHTNCSDGKLGVRDLLDRAADRHISLLSITDHDTVAAYPELDSLEYGNTKIIPGIEFSTRWQSLGIHVVGLNIDLGNAELLSGIEFQSAARQERAEKIARRLQTRLNIDDPLPAVTGLAGNDNIGRPHFAQHLLNIGVADSMEEVFKKYLGPGKPGDIRETWASMDQVISWITGAGGIAVLAHPLKYKLTRTRLSSLLDDFMQAGGTAVEVINGQQKPQETDQLARICASRNLLASAGSDFHDPDNRWSDLGQFARLPASCIPVWQHWTGQES